MLRSRSLLRFDIIALTFGVAALACSSSSTNPDSGASDDSGGAAEVGSGVDTGGGPPGCDSDGAPACAATTLSAGPDAGACVQCIQSMCAAGLTACGNDCKCGPAFACVLSSPNLSTGYNAAFSGCSDAVSALTNGNCAAMLLSACVPMNCNAPCFAPMGD
jgi:hypothetical protein